METDLKPQIKDQRILSLDALRGFAILTMVLSGVIPGTLPAWMFHAQVPPPDFVFNPKLPGITWVDLVFPFFLFSMGAAIPLALSRRIEKGMSMGKILWGIAERGFLLGSFALFVYHFYPFHINPEQNTTVRFLALFGFVLLFAMYARFPESWPAWLRWTIKIGGWAGTIIYLSTIHYQDEIGGGFNFQRRDIIIVILTNVAVWGTLAWLITRKNLLLRLGFLGIIMALRLGGYTPGWVSVIYNLRSIDLGIFKINLSWIYGLGMINYLFIAIPGTIVGDMFLDWMKKRKENSEPSWGVGKLWGIASLMIFFQIVLLVGLFSRWVPQTVIVCILLSILGWWLLCNPKTPTEQFLKSLFSWGTYFLILGLFFEPYEGGIKKDHATMSYYFVTSGLAIYFIIAFTIIGDILGKRKWMGLLVANGQNPMIAYVGVTLVIAPIRALVGLDPILAKIFDTPWLGFLGGCLITFVNALMVMFFTRKKIFWRT